MAGRAPAVQQYHLVRNVTTGLVTRLLPYLPGRGWQRSPPSGSAARMNKRLGGKAKQPDQAARRGKGRHKYSETE